MRLDLIAAIEACYAPIASDAEWMHHLCNALAPLDRGLGLGARIYDASDPVRPSGLASWGAEKEAAFARAIGVAGDAMVRALFWAPPAVTTLWRMTDGLDAPKIALLRDALEAVGIHEALGVYGAQPDHRGVLFAVFAERGYALPARTRRVLGKLSAHLLCAHRLRREGLCGDPGDSRCEAVLDPRGRVEDARGPARERGAREELASAVRRVERARGRARRVDPEEAAALWHGLVDGTWTLVDHIEADGRRRVLAVRTSGCNTGERGLTLQEQEVAAQASIGRSNKYIGYFLGFAPSTVASCLDRAARKLGVRSRRDFIRAFANTPPSPPPGRLIHPGSPRPERSARPAR